LQVQYTGPSTSSKLSTHAHPWISYHLLYFSGIIGGWNICGTGGEPGAKPQLYNTCHKYSQATVSMRLLTPSNPLYFSLFNLMASPGAGTLSVPQIKAFAFLKRRYKEFVSLGSILHA
jgi:hypothetical protein